MNPSYDNLAPLYDLLQRDIDVPSWSRNIHTYIQKYGPKQGQGEAGKLLVCDLGCGTGSVALELADLGYDVIGVDNSLEMLELAQEKTALAHKNILFLCQDMTALDLFGTVDVFLCLLDSVNHLLKPKDFKRMLDSFQNFLNPGGLFLFDVVIPEHLAVTLGNEFFYEDHDNYTLFWQNSFSSKSKISTSELTFFRKETSCSGYSRYDTVIRERVYTDLEIRQAIRNAGLELIKGPFDLLTNKLPERQFYLARRSAAN